MNNVGRTASKNWLSLVLIFFFTFSVSLVGARFVRSILVGNNSVAETKDNSNSNDDQDAPQQTTPSAIKLQPIIDSWIAEIDNRVGLVVYDLDRDEIAASYNSDTAFSTGDLYQLIFAYDGYRRLDVGLERADSNIGYELNYSDCLNIMTSTSASETCATAFLTDSYRSESAQNLINTIGMTQSSDFGQVTTPNDLVLFLQHVWQHDDLSLDSWAKLQASMLELPEESEIDWKQGLPSGFSTARVYSKASGTENDLGTWENYADIALIDFVRQNRHFAVVVLGENGVDPSDFSRLGTLIEGKVIEE